MKIGDKWYTQEQIHAAILKMEGLDYDSKKEYPIFGHHETNHIHLIDPHSTVHHKLFSHHMFDSCLVNCHKYKGIVVILGAFLINMVLGTFYCWGAISKYVASYLYHYDDSIVLEDLSGIFPFMGMCTNGALFFGVKIGERIGNRPVTWVGTIIFSAMVFACTWVKSYGSFVGVYAIINGIMGGLVYMNPLIACWKIYPKKRGELSGIIIGGYALGSFIFNFVALAIVNPEGEEPTILDQNGNKLFDYDNVAKNVPRMFLVLGICYFILAVVGNLLMLINLNCPKLPKMGAWLDKFSRHKKIIIGPREAKKAELLKGIENLNDPKKHVLYHDPHDAHLVAHHETQHEAHNQIQHETHHDEHMLDSNRADLEAAHLSSKRRFRSQGDLNDIDEHHATYKHYYKKAEKLKVEKKKSKHIEHVPFLYEDCPSFFRAMLNWRVYHLCLIAFCGVFYGLVVSNNYKNFGLTEGLSDNFLTLVGSLSAISNAFSRAILATLADHFGYRKVFPATMLFQLALAVTIQFLGKYQVAYLIWVFFSMAMYGGNFSIMPMITTKIYGLKVGPQVYGVIFIVMGLSNIFQYLLAKPAKQSFQHLFWIGFGLSVAACILSIFVKQKVNWAKMRPTDHEILRSIVHYNKNNYNISHKHHLNKIAGTMAELPITIDNEDEQKAEKGNEKGEVELGSIDEHVHEDPNIMIQSHNSAGVHNDHQAKDKKQT